MLGASPLTGLTAGLCSAASDARCAAAPAFSAGTLARSRGGTGGFAAARTGEPPACCAPMPGTPGWPC